LVTKSFSQMISLFWCTVELPACLCHFLAAEVPSSWEQTCQGNSNDFCHIVDLPSSSSEYKEVFDAFMTQPPGAPLDKALNITVVKIQRIQNHVLYTQYSGKKKVMETTNPQINNERRLFYSCADKMVQQICYQGFSIRSYRNIHSKRYLLILYACMLMELYFSSVILWQRSALLSKCHS